MKSLQRGFTLIELVIVIVLLGILAAIALPQYVDLTSDAEQAVVDGTKGALVSTAAILLAQNKSAQGITAIINALTTDNGVTVTAAGSCQATITSGSTSETITIPADLCN